MEKDGVVFSNRFEQPDFDEPFSDDIQADYKENIESADEFLLSLQRDIKLVPNKKRLADKDRFINAVRQLSEEYEIDADVKKIDSGYIAVFYTHSASYSGYIKKLLNYILSLADDFSIITNSENKNYEFIMSFTYHTHNVYLKGREITDFS